MLHTKSFSKLTAFAAVALTLSTQSLAAIISFNYVTCGLIEWSIDPSTSDFSSASYARLVVTDLSNLDDYVYGPEHPISTTGGDINQANTVFTYDSTFSSPPGGSLWIVEVDLLDSFGNNIPNDYVGFYYDNPCLVTNPATVTAAVSSATQSPAVITSTSSQTPSISTSSHSVGPTTTSPVPPICTGNCNPQQKSTSHVAAIAGGIAGAVALIAACFVFLFLRNRKAKQEANNMHNSNSGYGPGSMETGYPSGPISTVSVLPHSQSYGTPHEEVSKDYYESPGAPSTTTFSSPPTSPRMSATNRPMSNFSAGSGGGARNNNPLLNRQQINNSGWTASAPLAEPM